MAAFTSPTARAQTATMLDYHLWCGRDPMPLASRFGVWIAGGLGGVRCPVPRMPRTCTSEPCGFESGGKATYKTWVVCPKRAIVRFFVPFYSVILFRIDRKRAIMAPRPEISDVHRERYLEGRGVKVTAPTKQDRLGRFTIICLVLNRTIGE